MVSLLFGGKTEPTMPEGSQISFEFCAMAHISIGGIDFLGRHIFFVNSFANKGFGALNEKPW